MELVEVIEQARETIIAAMEAMALYLTVVSAYLVAAYTVGTKLKGYRMFFVTVLFLSFSVFFTIGSFSFLMLANGMYSNWGADEYNGGIEYYAYWIAGAELLGIVGSLYFMYDTSKSNIDT